MKRKIKHHDGAEHPYDHDPLMQKRWPLDRMRYIGYVQINIIQSTSVPANWIVFNSNGWECVYPTHEHARMVFENDAIALLTSEDNG